MKRGLALRLRRVPPRCALDSWVAALCLTASLLASALVGTAVVLLDQAALWVVFGLALPYATRLGEFLPRLADRLDVAGALGALLIVLAASVPGSPWRLALLLALFAAIATRRTQSEGGATTALLLAAGSTALMASLLEGGAVAALFALPNAALAATGLLWIQARHSRRQVRRAWQAPEEESLPGLRGRAMLGLGLAALLLALLPTADDLGTRAERSLRSWAQTLGGAAPDSGAEASNPIEGVGPVERTGAPRPGDQSAAPGLGGDSAEPARAIRSFPTELNLAGDLGLVRRPQGRRLELRVLFPPDEGQRFGAAQPAYLMTTSYDGFGPDGLQQARYDPDYEYTDDADGVLDGWSTLQPDPGRGTLAELEVRVAALRTPKVQPPRLTIPRIEPLLAVRQPQVRHQSSGMLSIPDDGRAVQQVQFRTRLRARHALELRTPLFDRSDARFLRLPDDPAWQPVLDEIREQIGELDARDAKLRAVLAHFWRNYDYSFAVPGSGVGGLRAFLDERRGYCSYFATSAMLMLRMLDIPCRVVGGYRVTRWDSERQAYQAGDTAAHAWVEVRLTDGWMTVDPTPAIALNEFLAMEQARIEQAEAAALEAQAAAAEAAPEEAAPAAAEVDGALAEEPAPTTSREAMEFGLVPLALLAVALVLLSRAIWVARHQAERVAIPHDWLAEDPSLATDDAFQRMLDFFVELGFRPGGRRTLLEFSRRLIRTHGRSYQPMLPITRAFYARRYGQHPLTGARWQHFLRFERAVRAGEFATASD